MFDLTSSNYVSTQDLTQMLLNLPIEAVIVDCGSPDA
jgi:hypothetical protein